MKLATIDEIVRRALLENGIPIHYYGEYLYHGATCLRELNFDTLQIINTVNLPVNSYGAADLPDDFSDDLSVSSNVGNALKALPKQNWLNPIRIHDTVNGNFVPYSDTDNNTFYSTPYAYNYYWNVDSYGSFTGRAFGANGGTESGYKIIKQRRQIQMTEDFNGGDIVLQYISNGQSVDNATQIDYMAFQTIRSYQEWKVSPNRNNERSSEAMAFYNQKRRLKTLLDPLTKADVMNIFHRGYTATAKT